MSPDGDLVTSERFNWYNAMLDPHVLSKKMTPKMQEAAVEGTYDDGTSQQGGRLCVPDQGHPHNLVSSLCRDGFHRPALDVDLDDLSEIQSKLDGVVGSTTVRILVPSSNHWHVYLPEMVLPWDEYVDLMDEMVHVGLLEEGYVAASTRRGQSLLRPPHVLKSDRTVRSAFEEVVR